MNENNESDFDDLIINATKKVESSTKFNNIKYIIIDEYQDISYIRLLLVKEIIKKTNCKLMAVGDDYQAIYGFSGSNISFFVEFTNYFPHSKIMFLKYTYRNSQELINIATKFIMKNKYQIKKEMKSNKTINSPIKIIYYKNIRKEIKRILNNIEGNILILGRNNKDVNYILDEEIVLNNTKIKYKDKTIEYMSVHKSKGLEYDNVILINMRNDTLGFPSRVIENKIFRLFKNEEYYKDAEERRLFYVALTRTKNNVFILVPKINSSPFIFELEKIIKSCNCNKKKNMAMLE